MIAQLYLKKGGEGGEKELRRNGKIDKILVDFYHGRKWEFDLIC